MNYVHIVHNVIYEVTHYPRTYTITTAKLSITQTQVSG